uniref:Uncharacterized protein n=1 Tax=Anguilla anguilla TaxID=7936 RepID=A0A0E9RRL5_ANGAN
MPSTIPQTSKHSTNRQICVISIIS